MSLFEPQNVRATLAEQESFWQKELSGELPVLALPLDHPRPPVQSFIRATESIELDQSLSRKMKALSAAQNVSLFVTLLAGLKAVLLRYSGQEEIIVGSLSSDSIREQTRERQERFANPIALRPNLSGDPTVKELLKRIAGTVEKAAANRDYPFERLVEQFDQGQNLSRASIFQVMLLLNNIPFCISAAPSSKQDRSNIEEYTARCDLVVLASEAEGGLSIKCEYDAELFEPATIKRLLGHFRVLLAGMATGTETRLSSLPLLTEPERRQLLVEWNDTRTNYPQDKCIHQLFEAQTEKTPDAIAVTFPHPSPQDEKSKIQNPKSKIQLTYLELNQQANQLAHYLQQLGVGPEVLVGLYIERSLEMVVGLLGILKAGGAYVPLDPTYPKERLAFMLEDARVPLLLTQKRLMAGLPKIQNPKPVLSEVEGSKIQNPQVLCLDTDWEAIAGTAKESEENPVNGATAGNLAYIMYTSGSTGKSKGVSVVHRGVVRLVKETNYANLTAQEIFLQLGSISFDASTFEIWGCLLNGGRLVVFPSHTPSLEELARVLHSYRVTTLWLTAGLLHQMVESQSESLRSVRQLLAGGDVLSTSHVREILQQPGAGRLINGYGPTENTTFTCCYPMTNPDQVGASVSIGRPITNTQVYVLNHRLHPVPIGAPGELYIGGDGLARGYWNRPGLTAERFIPNPFSDEPGACLYKTGDLVRYLPDGNIEFLGRLDNQLKIRGFRIEPGEIEAALTEHPAVREVVVMARNAGSTPGSLRPRTEPSDKLKTGSVEVTGKQLVAYFVAAREPTPTITELRRFLKRKLPDYMAPSAFVRLDAMPLTPNGKVDRHALPTPGTDRPELVQSFVAPRNPVEEVLAQIWAQVLNLERVGVHDDFFELGGHSLLATQVISRLHKTFRLALPVRSLFENPTVAGLAEALSQYETSPGQVAATARLRQKLNQMSAAEIQVMVRAKQKTR